MAWNLTQTELVRSPAQRITLERVERARCVVLGQMPMCQRQSATIVRATCSGLGCMPCLSGSVPNDVVGSTFCVSCSLENEPQTAGARYSTVDWFACLLNAVSCPPGEAFNGDMTGCILCSDQGPSFHSPLGVRCDMCPPGTMPSADRSVCNDCAPGSYSPAGICSACESLGANYFSAAGSTRCSSCGAGTEPAADRGSCRTCDDGFYSPYGVCMACAPGKQSDSSRSACEACGAYSADGMTCTSCPDGKEPILDRTACTDCPQGTLGNGGTCVAACAALGCHNVTVSTTTDAAIISSLADLCPRAAAWTSTGPGKTVTDSTGTCTSTSCNFVAPVGRTAVVFSGISPGATATCQVSVFITLARVVLSPTRFTPESLSTAFADEMMRIENEGDDPVVIYEINFDAGWVSVPSLRFATGGSVTLPATLLSAEALLVVVRSAGTAVPPGRYLANGTVVSSNSNDRFSVSFTVTPAALRVVALPSVLPVALMRAGQPSASSFCTIYNVDTNIIYWQILNCSSFDDNDGARVRFSTCGSSNHSLDIAAQAPVAIRFAAPTAIGIYTNTYTVVGSSAQGASSDWVLEATIQVVPDTIAPTQSSLQASGSVVAGRDGELIIVPRDRYDNVISDWQMEFIVNVSDPAPLYLHPDVLSFPSLFNHENEEFRIAINLPHDGPFVATGYYTALVIGQTLPLTVICISCDPETSTPTPDCGGCLCNHGFARRFTPLGRQCKRCDPGDQPMEDREDGCESCGLYPGTSK